MNRNILFIVIASLIIGFTACQKDEATSTKTQNISEADLQTARKITSFIEKMENPILLKDGGGSGETIGLEEARWNLEAALNYQYCSVPENISDIHVDSLEVTLPVNDNLCDASDVAALYQQLCTAVAEQAGTEEFQLMAVGVSLQEQKVNEAIFKVYYFGSTIPIPVHLLFKEWEYYRAKDKNNLPYCGGPLAGHPKNKHLMTEMRTKVNAMLPAIASPNGQVYFTDLENINLTSYRKENPNWDGIDILKKYNMFYLSHNGIHPDNVNPCLSPEILNFYFISITNALLGDPIDEPKPEGKSLIGIYYISATGCSGTYQSSYWVGKVQFGKVNVKPEEIEM